MATAILDSLRHAVVEPPLPILPQREWDRANQLRRHLHVAQSRRWRGAVDELIWEFKRTVGLLSRYLENCRRDIDNLTDTSTEATLNLRQT